MGCLLIFVACAVFVLVVGGLGGGSQWVLTEMFGVTEAQASDASTAITIIVIAIFCVIWAGKAYDWW